jgi:hypothetical protein
VSAGIFCDTEGVKIFTCIDGFIALKIACLADFYGIASVDIVVATECEREACDQGHQESGS